ncbi:DUF2637 domain-containing protein [Streptomyces sp. NPDC002814]
MFDLDAWIRPLCALVVAGVAAYTSYVHQRGFTRQRGVDEVSASSLWPLSVDGLSLLATVGLLKSSGLTRRARAAMWSAFLLGIAVLLARTSRRRLLWRGSRCWWPGGRLRRCCSLPNSWLTEQADEWRA